MTERSYMTNCSMPRASFWRTGIAFGAFLVVFKVFVLACWVLNCVVRLVAAVFQVMDFLWMVSSSLVRADKIYCGQVEICSRQKYDWDEFI